MLPFVNGTVVHKQVTAPRLSKRKQGRRDWDPPQLSLTGTNSDTTLSKAGAAITTSVKERGSFDVFVPRDCTCGAFCGGSEGVFFVLESGRQRGCTTQVGASRTCAIVRQEEGGDKEKRRGRQDEHANHGCEFPRT